jgi:hypothetical protein
MSEEKELTQAQTEQQDAVDDACFNLIRELAGEDVSADDIAKGDQGGIEWDMELIGIVREAVQEVICDRLKLKTEMEFYPYIESESDGEELSPAIVEFMARIDTQNIAELVLSALLENDVEQTMDNADIVWESVCDVLAEDIKEATNAKLDSGQLTVRG